MHNDIKHKCNACYFYTQIQIDTSYNYNNLSFCMDRYLHQYVPRKTLKKYYIILLIQGGSLLRSHKWSYNPYEWPYLLTGVVSPFIPGPPCTYRKDICIDMSTQCFFVMSPSWENQNNLYTISCQFNRRKACCAVDWPDTPPKTNMTMKHPPFEDVFPHEHGEFPMSRSFSREVIAFQALYTSIYTKAFRSCRDLRGWGWLAEKKSNIPNQQTWKIWNIQMYVYPEAHNKAHKVHCITSLNNALSVFFRKYPK